MYIYIYIYKNIQSIQQSNNNNNKTLTFCSFRKPNYYEITKKIPLYSFNDKKIFGEYYYTQYNGSNKC